MLKKLLISAFAIATISAAAAESPKITVRDALSLAVALRNLDGHMIVIKQGQTENTVMVPWDFASAALRLRTANDLSIVSNVERIAEQARQGLIRSILQKSGEKEIKPGTPEYDDFQKQYNELLDQPAPGTQDLSRIKASELRLEKNEIPVTVLVGLKPILEMDQ